jgi:hypothetical protein
MMLIEAIADYLETEGVATKGTDMFLAVQPDSPDNCLTIYDTGGFAPDNELPIKDPTIQVISRATDYETAKQEALDVYGELHKLANQTLGDFYIYLIEAMQEPGSIGRDSADRFEISCNYRLKVRE